MAGKMRVPLRIIFLSLIATLLSGTPLEKASAVASITSSTAYALYVDAPFVQGSYIAENYPSNSLTDDYNSASPDNSACVATGTVGTYSGGDCTVIFSVHSGVAYKYGGALTTSSTPTSGTSNTRSTSVGVFTSPGETITLSSPKNYVGFWWSAGSTGNSIEFYKNGLLQVSVTGDDVYNGITKTSSQLTALDGTTKYTESDYYGHPYNHLDTNWDPSEPFVYFHLFAQNGLSFDQIRIRTTGNGFEFDNLTVANLSGSALTPKSTLVGVGGYGSTNKITFDSRGGSSVDSQTVVNGVTAKVTSTVPTRAGYTFTHWNSNSGDTGTAYSPNSTYPSAGTVSSDATLYGQWTANSLNVSFDSQGGTSFSSETTTTGASISTSPGTPTRPGYTFTGWFASSSGGSSINFPYAHNQTVDFTLYAQWNSNSGGYSPRPAAVLPQVPGITWRPKEIYEGEPITKEQLNAQFTVPGKTTYSVPLGFKPTAGVLTIKVTFTPDDQVSYLVCESSIDLDVLTLLKDSEQPGDTNAIEDPKNIDTAKLKRLNTIYFNTNEFFLDAVDRKILLSIAQSIEQGKYSTILILGHTDIKKGLDNQLLSQERAEAVADYIQNLSPSATLKKAWYGPNRPVTKALDKRSLQLNRRTEIYLIR